MLAAILPCIAHLPVDLRFAEDHRVESGRNAEEMANRVAIPPHIEVGTDVGAESLGHQPGNGCRRRVRAFADVELGAVAGRENNRLVRRRPLADGAQNVAGFRCAVRQLLANLDRRGEMVDPATISAMSLLSSRKSRSRRCCRTIRRSALQIPHAIDPSRLPRASCLSARRIRRPHRHSANRCAPQSRREFASRCGARRRRTRQ